MEKNNDKQLKDIIKDNAINQLNIIMDNWCKNYNNNCTGGKMRGDRGDDIEKYTIDVINNIGKIFKINLIAINGNKDKKDLKIIIKDKEFIKKHQVDIHIYLDEIFIAVIECKAYLDSCYYVRACDDFKLFKKFGYNIKNYIFTLENSIDEDTIIFTDYINDNICNNIFYMLDGKRSSIKPIYNSKFKKSINLKNLNNFIEVIYRLCNI